MATDKNVDFSKPLPEGLVLILGGILGAWMRFKETGDLQNLFMMLSKYENFMKGK